ncbi:unannotated protein [freshwater metagenome]|uniref:Unannotated protein n=1 Tax=freshwater metagenome TaxID=449393 RepID=A0A6J6SHY2_9ZZZZ
MRMTEPPLPAESIEGIADFTVRHTPVRFTSMTSFHCSSEIFQNGLPGEMIPAFATTTCTGPSTSIPRSTTACTAEASRTSAAPATMRPPAASTIRTVSARSSLVAIG